MTRELKEANKLYSVGKWSIVGDSLFTTNSIQSPHQLVNVSYDTDPYLSDSVMLVRIVDHNNLPVSGFLSTSQIEGDSSFRNTDYLFGKTLVPRSTTQIRVLLLLISREQLTYSVNIANGNLITLKIVTEDPKFYDIYDNRKFLIVSRKRKLVPNPNFEGNCILAVGRDAKRIN